MDSPAPLFSRIDTVIVRVRDVDRARDWYSDKLGLRSVFDDPAERLSVLDAGGCSLTLWELKPGESAGAAACGTFPIFAAEDAEAAHAELGRRGVAAEPVQEGGSVRFFTFRDPDGNRLEACQVL